jgi:hypothetical protein
MKDKYKDKSKIEEEVIEKCLKFKLEEQAENEGAEPSTSSVSR